MTSEDRELLQALRRQQIDLQRSLARLDVQLEELEARARATPAETPATPLPPLPIPPPIPPPMERPVAPETKPPLPPVPVVSVPKASSSAFPPLPPVPAASFEFHFGHWLIGIGAVFGVITLAVIFGFTHSFIYRFLGPAGILGLSAAAGIGVCIAGNLLDRCTDARRFLGRVLMAMALAWLYLTAYAAYYYEPLQVIHSPIIAGFLLLLWSGYVLFLAERKHSQTLALFAITLAYFSTAMNPIGRFTMAADLLLALSAVIFLIRNGWAALSYLSLLLTYGTLLHRLVVDENGDLVLDTSRVLHFWPYAIYLFGAWLIYTAAVMFSTAPSFSGGKRLAFLSLNNGAMAGLLLLTAYIAGYGHGPVGWILLGTGLILLVTSRFIGWTRIDPEKVMAAYAAQGLALLTAGIIVFFTGVTRGVVLMLEALFFGIAGSFSRDRVLAGCTYFAGFFGTLFLIWEIAVGAHHPWLLGFGGAWVMLHNAWLSRGEIMHSPKARSTIVLSTAYYCVLAVGLIFTVLDSELSENALPPALALAALMLTFLIYHVSLYELPPIAQTLLLAAQALVLFPADTGETQPWWTTAAVAAVTLLMLTWWSRQRVTRSGSWVILLNLVYALALAGLAYQTIRPRVDLQQWMIDACFLSIAFLLWGAFTRVWAIAAVGQLFLGVAVYHFFNFFGPAYPWTWRAAALPLVVTFSTARAAHEWLRLSPEISDSWRIRLRALAYGYQLLALAMIVRWINAKVPALDQVATFLFLGTALLVWNTRRPSAFGIRCSFVLTFAGLWSYLENLDPDALSLATFLNGLAFLSLLAQPAFLRRMTLPLISQIESWALILLSTGAGLLFVSEWMTLRFSSAYLTMGWALYAVFLYLFGLFVAERRQQWCGIAVLLVALVRVAFFDMWGLSNIYKVLTLIVLTVVTLGLGFLVLRNAGQTKKAE
jgi:hypothetical protein